MSEIAVGFGDHVVTIRSGHAGILEVLARRFAYLPARAGGRIVGEVEVTREGGQYLGRWAQDTHRTSTVSRIARWAQYRVIESFIHARSDLIWLHGAAAGCGDAAVILPGRRGVGKSTLVSALWSVGCTFLTDDILPLEPSTVRVLPFPQLPAIRVDPGKDLPNERVPALPKHEVAVTERIASAAMPVTAIVLPNAQRGATAAFEPCGPAEAALLLLEGCWNFDRHGQALALERLTTLCEAVPARRLVFGDPAEAAGLVRGWAAELGQRGVPRPAIGTL